MSVRELVETLFKNIRDALWDIFSLFKSDKNSRCKLSLALFLALFGVQTNILQDECGFILPFLGLIFSGWLLIYLLYRFRHKLTLTAFNSIFRRLLSPDRIYFYDFVGVIGLLFLTGWTTDAIREGTFFDGVSNFLNMSSFLFLFVILHPEEKDPGEIPVPSKVLVMALSKFNTKNLPAATTNAAGIALLSDALKSQTLEESRITNWAPIFLSLIHHRPQLKKVILLVSPQAGQFLPDFKSLAVELKTSYGLDFELVTVEELDLDNWNMVLEKTHAALALTSLLKLKRDDLTFNISGGTAAVSAALMLLALKGNWQVEYFKQDRSQLVRFPKKHEVFLV